MQIAIADVCGNLYKLRTENKVCAVGNSTDDCIHKRHSTLGHRDIRVVKTLASGEVVNGISFGDCTEECNEKLNCETCLQGKMSKL